MQVHVRRRHSDESISRRMVLSVDLVVDGDVASNPEAVISQVRRLLQRMPPEFLMILWKPHGTPLHMNHCISPPRWTYTNDGTGSPSLSSKLNLNFA